MVELGAKTGARMGAILSPMVQNAEMQYEKDSSGTHARKSHHTNDNRMPSKP